MELPINLTKAPFKVKYLDEETQAFARWMTFGSSIPGTVDITDALGNDIMIGVPLNKALSIVRDRNHWVENIIKDINTP